MAYRRLPESPPPPPELRLVKTRYFPRSRLLVEVRAWGVLLLGLSLVLLGALLLTAESGAAFACLMAGATCLFLQVTAARARGKNMRALAQARADALASLHAGDPRSAARGLDAVLEEAHTFRANAPARWHASTVVQRAVVELTTGKLDESLAILRMVASSGALDRADPGAKRLLRTSLALAEGLRGDAAAAERWLAAAREIPARARGGPAPPPLLPFRDDLVDLEALLALRAGRFEHATLLLRPALEDASSADPVARGRIAILLAYAIEATACGPESDAEVIRLVNEANAGSGDAYRFVGSGWPPWAEFLARHASEPQA